MDFGWLRGKSSFWVVAGICVTGVFLMSFIGAERVEGRADGAATAEEARAFTDAAEKKLLDLWTKSSRASWVHENFITEDTTKISADADLAVKSAVAQLAFE